MMLKTFTYDGTNSGTAGLYVLNSNTYNSASRSVEIGQVTGANGDIITDFDAYDNIQIDFEVVLRPQPNTTLEQQITAVKALLYKKKYKYFTLSTNYEAGTYRKGVFIGPIDWETRLRKYGKATVSFQCKPQKWTQNGHMTRSITAGGSMNIILTSQLTNRATEYLDVPVMVLDLGASTGITGNIVLQSNGASDFSKIKINFGDDPVTLIDSKINVLGDVQLLLQTTQVNTENINRYISQMFGNWFMGMDFSETIGTGGITVANNSNKSVSLALDWERWTV